MGMDPMTKEERDVQRKLKVLRHAEKTGPAGTGRPFHRRYMSEEIIGKYGPTE